MRREEYQQIAAVEGHSAEEFENNFNDRMSELKEKTIIDTKVELANGFRATILYEEKYEPEPRTVRDEYHDIGMIFLCKQCPHVDPPTDGRVKHMNCKYAEYGHTRIDCECCEMFYKELKQGLITPRYIR